jgi:hypothetical protein
MTQFERTNVIYYLESIKRNLDVLYELASETGPSIPGEALADNRDWLDCYIDYLRRTE